MLWLPSASPTHLGDATQPQEEHGRWVREAAQDTQTARQSVANRSHRCTHKGNQQSGTNLVASRPWSSTDETAWEMLEKSSPQARSIISWHQCTYLAMSSFQDPEKNHPFSFSFFLFLILSFFLFSFVVVFLSHECPFFLFFLHLVLFYPQHIWKNFF